MIVVHLGATALHVRNRHRLGYDMARLGIRHPALNHFLFERPDGVLTVDFSHPSAVSALNAALLSVDYGIEMSLPPGYLVPAVPGRADYVHILADLLAEEGSGRVPQGEAIVGLDVGVGASGIYPLLAHAEYGWRFIGIDVSAQALENCGRLARLNRVQLELRRQNDARFILRSVLRNTDRL